MKLTEIRVRGLFGRFDHKIDFPNDQRVTIMIAPNGFGKTTILRLINVLFNQDVRSLRPMPCDQLVVRFEDTSKLTVNRIDAPGKSRRQSPSKVNVLFERAGHQEDLTPEDLLSPERDIPLGMIEEWVPNLERVGVRSWADTQTGQRFTLEEAIEKHSRHLPAELQAELGVPKRLTAIQNSVAIRFVDTERLTRSRHRTRYRRLPPERSNSERTVHFYSRSLGATIQQTLTEYGSLSQSLDRTIPARLVNEPLQSELVISGFPSFPQSRRSQIDPLTVKAQADYVIDHRY